jgi:GNAT superfamily N-acetyltransferase
VEKDQVRSEFDAQVRRSTTPDGSGAVGERAGPVVRWFKNNGAGWSGVVWSDLDPGTADAAIADQVAFYAARGERFEWKLYDYDQPPDLGDRLLAAGFAAEEPEAFVVAGTAQIVDALGPAEAILPAGVRLVPVTDEAGVDLLIQVRERVFGPDDDERWRDTLIRQLRSGPAGTMVVAMAGDEPVSSARIDLCPGTDFAGLWGGGTLPQWRGRGIYRALVAYRARLAAAHGYRYLQVDASPQSRPILERLGFACLAVTTPYVWSPGERAAGLT